MVAGVMVGSLFAFFLGVLKPAAGPDWMWAGGRNDVIRSLYFQPNGSFRRFGRLALAMTLLAGSASVMWFLRLL